MAPKSDDRRKRIRVPVQQKIRHSRYQVLGTPIFEENSAVDLSSNGISFQTEQEYKKGALVLLEVVIEEQLLKLLVCVAWVKKDGQKYTVGAELIAIDPEHKKQMQGHLASLIQKFTKKTPAKKKSKKKASKKKVAKKISKKKTAKKSSKKKSVSKKKKRRS